MRWLNRFFSVPLRLAPRRGAGWLCLLLAGLGLTRLGGAAESASTEFCAESFPTEGRLPQRAVVALLAARSGHLWIGTYGGLARFDGERFTVFTAGQTPGLQDFSATALAEDDAGAIWIGHEQGGLTRMAGGVFQPVRAGSGRDGPVNSLTVDARGEVWVVTERGGLQRVSDGLTWPKLPEVASPATAPMLVTADRSRQVWVAQAGQAARVRENALEAWSPTPATGTIRRLGARRDGSLTVLTAAGLGRWQDGVWTLEQAVVPWGSAYASLLQDTRHAGLVVGTFNQGLFYRKDGQGWHNLNRTNGLPDNWIRALTEDREGNIWVGTSGGLTVLRPRKVVMHDPPDSWQGKPVMPVVWRRNGELWAGTEGAGVYRLKDREWRHFGEAEGLGNPFVWTLLEDRRGELWVGTWRGGIFRLAGERFVRVPELEGITESVTALTEDAAGALWIGTGAGLVRFHEGRTEWFGRDVPPLLPDVRALVTAPDGALWAGTARHGLARWQHGQWQVFGPAEGLPTRAVQTLHWEGPETLWIGTLDRGLVRWRAGRCAVIGTTQGLPQATIFHIADDGLGFFWCSSPGGIFRAAKADLHACADGTLPTVNFVHYGRGQGMATPTCSGGFQPAGLRTPDGHLWFPTAQGLAELDPAGVRPNPLPPPVGIEEARVDGEPAALVANTPVPPARKLVVPPGGRRVQIRYTGLAFSSPERVRFRYRLEGLEGEWVEAGTQRTAFYSFLAPGRYVFRVTACNHDGVWQSEPAELAVIVLPAWWQTWWCRAGGLGAVAAVLSGSVWLSARARLRRRLELLGREQALERERARIAQDIHDDLGASLTRISMLSEAAGDDPPDPRETAHSLAQISTTARELTRAMDEIVWAVNPRHDTLDSLVNYLVRFAQDFLSAAGMRCRLDVPLQVPERHLRAELRHNLFLAYKEALNNVVKHARATEVKVSLSLAPEGFELVVADNGVGFTVATAGHANRARDERRIADGNGLDNMRHRLAQIGGTCEWDSQPGEGTRVRFGVPYGS